MLISHQPCSFKKLNLEDLAESKLQVALNILGSSCTVQKKLLREKRGEGLAIGVLNTLEPSWISKGNDDIETITVEIWLQGFPVRLVCGYGPQENDTKVKKEGFWEYLDKEVHKASSEGAGLIIQMDGNL